MNRDSFSKMICIRRNFELESRCYSNGEPVQVDIFLDEKNNIAYQVDWRSAEVRSANLKQTTTYGNWEKIN